MVYRPFADTPEIAASRAIPRRAPGEACARLVAMPSAPSEPLSQRLAAIRDQLKLLADYL